MRRFAYVAPWVLGLSSILIIYAAYASFTRNIAKISPQGCRMSWMNPSFILRSNLDSSWTRLADRYRLWLYREEGWDSEHGLSGNPVLFIPGNAGSYQQVRSIASSAARQFYESPGHPSRTFTERSIKPLDVFTVDFNEEFSALHGPTLRAQVDYVTSAVDYICSLYSQRRPPVQVILLGHSMGGIVARAALPNGNISAIITMSAPNSLPPGRLDGRIDQIYDLIKQHDSSAEQNGVPVLAICGGATDVQIPSETCILPGALGRYRRTVHTTSVPGIWSGVGHQEMVWCHQVRWRVARAALELGAPGLNQEEEKAATLDRWFGADHYYDAVPLFAGDVDLIPTHTTTMEAGRKYSLAHASPHMYLLRLPERDPSMHTPSNLTLLYSGARLLDSYTSPMTHPWPPSPVEISVFTCEAGSSVRTPERCSPLRPANRPFFLLLPLVNNQDTFPSMEGVDEGDAVSYWSTRIGVNDWAPQETWIGIRVDGAAEEGWIIGGFQLDSISGESVVAVGKYGEANSLIIRACPFWY